MLVVLRDADKELFTLPDKVTTGTPIHRTSQVVVAPLNSKVSSATSTSWHAAKNSR